MLQAKDETIRARIFIVGKSHNNHTKQFGPIYLLSGAVMTDTLVARQKAAYLR